MSPKAIPDKPTLPDFPLFLVWGLSNGGLRPHSTICTQSSTIVHFCGLLGPFLRELSSQNDDNRRQSCTIVDKCLKPPFAKSPFRLSRVFSRADHPHVPHYPFLELHFFDFFSCVFCSMPGLIRTFCISYGLTTKKMGMTGFVRDGLACNPSKPRKKTTENTSNIKEVPCPVDQKRHLDVAGQRLSRDNLVSQDNFEKKKKPSLVGQRQFDRHFRRQFGRG